MALGTIGSISPGDPIKASLLNHLIQGVNRVESSPLTKQRDFVGKFPGGVQGIVLPALLDDGARESFYNTGDVLVITEYLYDADDLNLESGADRNFGVTVREKKISDSIGRAIAVVVDTVDNSGTGTVCVSGACLAKVNRIASSPVVGEDPAQVTGTLLPGNTYFSIGVGAGDADLLWEEDSSEAEHFAYVTLPGGGQGGIPAINSSGTEIPPFSALESTGEDSNGRMTLIKPSEDNLTQIYISPAFPIPSGVPFDVLTPEDGKVTVSGSPVVGDSLGTAENQWYLLKDNEGFTYQGGSASEGRVKSTGGGGSVFLYRAVSDASGGTIRVKAVNSSGVVVGDEIEMLVIE